MSGLRFKIVAIFNNAFFVSSPIDREGVVDDGGLVSRVMMSDDACWTKSSAVMDGNFTCFGKNTNVSDTISFLVVGRKQVMQR